MNHQQKAIIRFLRKHDLSIVHLFLLWREGQDVGHGRISTPELAEFSISFASRNVPKPPLKEVFSQDEEEIVFKLLDLPYEKAGYKGPQLVSYCLWERLFPEWLRREAASQILLDAAKAEKDGDLSGWVNSVMQIHHLYYAYCFDLPGVGAYRATSKYSVSDDEFKEFLESDSVRNKPKPKIPGP